MAGQCDIRHMKGIYCRLTVDVDDVASLCYMYVYVSKHSLADWTTEWI